MRNAEWSCHVCFIFFLLIERFVPIAIPISDSNAASARKDLFNLAARLRCSCGADGRSSKSPMPCRLNLIVKVQEARYPENLIQITELGFAVY